MKSHPIAIHIGRNALIILLVICLQDVHSLHITKKTISSRNRKDCSEVLTKNLECPSIGSYPVAGVCDYFARCIQTEVGIESEVDFCPDGHNYVVNRCIKNYNPDDCPQKSCSITNPNSITATGNSKESQKTTSKTISINGLQVPTMAPYPIAEPTHKTKKPLLNQLHPPKNDVACCSKNFRLIMYLLTINITYFVLSVI